VFGRSVTEPVNQARTNNDRANAFRLEGQDNLVQRNARGASARWRDRCVLVENSIDAFSSRLRPYNAGAAGVNVRFPGALKLLEHCLRGRLMVGICRIYDGICARRGSSQNVAIIKCAMDRGNAKSSHPPRTPLRAYEPGNLVPRGGQRYGDRSADIA